MSMHLPEHLATNLREPFDKVSKAYDEGHLPPVLLFAGPSGVGKKALVMEVARRLLCRGAQKPCGQCLPCKVSRVHADWDGETMIQWLVPMKAGENSTKDDRQAKAQELGKKIALDPWTMDIFDKGAGHVIGSARDLMASLAMASEDPRVIVIPEAERMNPNTANALLKTLEEAPPNTWFLLTTSNKARMMRTLISRSTLIQVPPMEHGDFERHARGESPELHAAPEQDLTLLYALSEGCWARARAWTGRDLGKTRERVLKFMDLVRMGSHGERMAWLQETGLADAKHKEALEELIQLCYVVVGDLVGMQAGVMPRNRDWIETLNPYKDLAPLAMGQDILKLLGRALDWQSRYVPGPINLTYVWLEWERLVAPQGNIR